MAVGNGRRVGIALGEGTLTGVLLDRRRSVHGTVKLSLELDGSDPAPELARAFGELKSLLEQSSGEALSPAAAHVALLPPLADARVVPFPGKMLPQLEIPRT